MVMQSMMSCSWMVMKVIVMMIQCGIGYESSRLIVLLLILVVIVWFDEVMMIEVSMMSIIGCMKSVISQVLSGERLLSVLLKRLVRILGEIFVIIWLFMLLKVLKRQLLSVKSMFSRSNEKVRVLVCLCSVLVSRVVKIFMLCFVVWFDRV